MTLGLGTIEVSHNCFSGSFLKYFNWEKELVRVAWKLPILKLCCCNSFGTIKPPVNDPLIYLIDTSNSSGRIDVKNLEPLVDRLEELLPEIKRTTFRRICRHR